MTFPESTLNFLIRSIWYEHQSTTNLFPFCAHAPTVTVFWLRNYHLVTVPYMYMYKQTINYTLGVCLLLVLSDGWIDITYIYCPWYNVYKISNIVTIGQVLNSSIHVNRRDISLWQQFILHNVYIYKWYVYNKIVIKMKKKKDVLHVHAL